MTAHPAPARAGTPNGLAAAPDVTSHTVMFLDLSRFTSLTDTHGDAAAVEVVDRFLGAVHAAVAERGRVVKTLGDGVLVHAHGPAAAIEVAAAVTETLHTSAGMPELTGGIATGPVVERDGDVLGAIVNLAARLADLAPAGELRMTEPAARAAAEGGWQVEPLGPITIRGFHDPVDAFAVVLCRSDRCVVDPVCGMRITPGSGTPSVHHEGINVAFCSTGCADRFADSPRQYLPVTEVPS